jgi:hypothetical protein
VSNHELYGHVDAVVQGDNILKSKERYAAIEAVKRGTATQEQIELVAAADQLYQDAMSQRSK